MLESTEKPSSTRISKAHSERAVIEKLAARWAVTRADGVFQDVARAAEVVAKVAGGMLVDEAVPVAVRTDLVPLGVNLADQAGMALGHPAKDEERALHLPPIEQRQDPPGVGDDAALPLVPLVTRDVLLKRRDLVVVFDIDGEGVQDLHGEEGRGRVNQESHGWHEWRPSNQIAKK